MFGLLGGKPKSCGKLLVHIVEGKEMPAMDIGGKSDCFVHVKIGKFEHKTKVIKSNLNPQWNEKFDVEIGSMNDIVDFFVYDWDQLTRNDLIGKVSYKLSDLKFGQNDLWLNLPQKQNKFPLIHVVLQIQPKMIVKVIEGKDLPAMDIGGKSDPFVEIIYMKHSHKTKVCKSTLNPNWNETFEFEVWDTSNILYVNVYDWDLMSKNDPMGAAIVSLTSLKVGTNDLWLNLPKKGAIHLEIDAQGFGQQQIQQQQQINQFGQQTFQQQTFFNPNQQFNQQQQFNTNQQFNQQQSFFNPNQQYNQQQQQQQNLYNPNQQQQQNFYNPNQQGFNQQSFYNTNQQYNPNQQSYNTNQYTNQGSYNTNQQSYNPNSYNSYK